MNKSYIAFDATGVQDPINSNLHSLHQMLDWQKNYPSRFDFVNKDEIDFSALHDDLLDSTTKERFLKLMEKADNLVVLASSVMDVESPILNWQISRSVNRFKLPVIVCYVGLTKLTQDSIHEHWKWLPNKIRKYIGLDSARMCHIPLTADKLERAISTFSVSTGVYPWDSTTIF